jgi:hypothetical protein
MSAGSRCGLLKLHSVLCAVPPTRCEYFYGCDVHAAVQCSSCPGLPALCETHHKQLASQGAHALHAVTPVPRCSCQPSS